MSSNERGMSVPHLGSLIRRENKSLVKRRRTDQEGYRLFLDGDRDNDGVIGRGQFGTVSLIQGPGRRIYAIKQPFWKSWNCSWDAEAYLKEVHSRGIKHEHILSFLGLLRDDQHPYDEGSTQVILDVLVMEYLFLGSLDDIEDVSTEEMGMILKQSLQALSFLHNEITMKHGNIKPSNILVQSRTPELKVKLSDFLLEPLYNYLPHQSFYGISPYAAPEIALVGHGTTAVDIWALGATGYELIAGSTPFPPRAPRDWTSTINSAVNDRAGQVGVERPLLRRMLELDPLQRASAKECLSDPWISSFFQPSKLALGGIESHSTGQSSGPSTIYLSRSPFHSSREESTNTPYCVRPAARLRRTPGGGATAAVPEAKMTFQAGANRSLVVTPDSLHSTSNKIVQSDNQNHKAVRFSLARESQSPPSPPPGTETFSQDQDTNANSTTPLFAAEPAREEYDEMRKGLRKMVISARQAPEISSRKRSWDMV